MSGLRKRPGPLIARLRHFARRAWRKAIHRRARFGLVEAKTSEVRSPPVSEGVVIERWGPERYDEALAANPHALEGDATRLRRQRTVLVVARQGDRLLGQTWLTSGVLDLPELGRTITCGSTRPLSTRSYVVREERGRGLLGALLDAAAHEWSPEGTGWAIIYDVNGAANRVAQQTGWTPTADLDVRVIADRHRLSVSPRAPSAMADHLRRPRPALAVLVAEQTWGATLHAARALHDLGVEVRVVVLGPGSAIFRRSRSIADAVEIDRSGAGLAEVVDRWRSTASQVAPTVVLPCSDRALLAVDELRGRPTTEIVVIAPDASTTATLLGKDAAFQLAEHVGLSVPAWIRVDDDHPLDGATDLPLPAIVRPQRPDRVADGWKFTRCDHRSDLEAVVADRGTGSDGIVVSEFVAPTGGIWFGLVWRSLDGSVHHVCTGRKRRTAHPDGGVMAWGEVVDRPAVAEAATAYAEAADFVGLGGIELIDDGERLHFVEFNLRMEAIAFAAAAAGTDHAVAAYLDALTGTPTPLPGPMPAAVWIGAAWWARLRAEPAAWRLLIGDRLRFARSPRRTRAVVSRRDLGPALALAWRALRSGTRPSGSPAGDRRGVQRWSA